MSETPRTDASAWCECNTKASEVVLAKFARQLERELNASHEQYQQLVKEKIDVEQEASKLEEERDKLRAELEETKVLLHQVGRGEVDSRLRRERDELHADKERLDWLENHSTTFLAVNYGITMLLRQSIDAAMKGDKSKKYAMRLAIHTHVSGATIGKESDVCARCGLDFRHPVHRLVTT
jgi:hypothetical protein